MKNKMFLNRLNYMLFVNIISMSFCMLQAESVKNLKCYSLNNAWFSPLNSEQIRAIAHEQKTYPISKDSCNDLIVLKDSTVIVSKIIEINEKMLKYKLCNTIHDSISSIERTQVHYVRYPNGNVEYFKNEPLFDHQEVKLKTDTIVKQKLPEKEHYFSVNCFPGWLNRARIRFETKYPNRNALNHAFTFFYGKMNLGPVYHFEYRRYNKESSLFFYSKIGAGATFSKYQNVTFAVGGIGFGQRNSAVNKRFFIEFTQGIQVPYLIKGKIDFEVPPFFYLTGPGSIINLNINLVWIITY